jgi:hypothetical protein
MSPFSRPLSIPWPGGPPRPRRPPSPNAFAGARRDAISYSRARAVSCRAFPFFVPATLRNDTLSQPNRQTSQNGDCTKRRRVLMTRRRRDCGAVQKALARNGSPEDGPVPVIPSHRQGARQSRLRERVAPLRLPRRFAPRNDETGWLLPNDGLLQRPHCPRFSRTWGVSGHRRTRLPREASGAVIWVSRLEAPRPGATGRASAYVIRVVPTSAQCPPTGPSGRP